MPVTAKAHHTQFWLTPPVRTRSVTRFGVSVENVVATSDTPRSHHGSRRPERKNSWRPEPARRITAKPMATQTMPYSARTIQSMMFRRMVASEAGDRGPQVRRVGPGAHQVGEWGPDRLHICGERHAQPTIARGQYAQPRAARRNLFAERRAQEELGVGPPRSARRVEKGCELLFQHRQDVRREPPQVHRHRLRARELTLLGPCRHPPKTAVHATHVLYFDEPRDQSVRPCSCHGPRHAAVVRQGLIQ